MAEIYRARTRSTAEQASRWVAIKMMRTSIGHEELREQLFKREARIASMIHHENVIPLFQFGLEMERYFIAMEYVRGRDLSHLLRNEKQIGPHLSFELGLYIGLNAAAGLGHAHRLLDENGVPLGIVHRDMSPGNVMVGYDGSVQVLDFGVARINENEGMQTQTGTLRGKFAYMSPEQTLGEPLDARSDVFSLGTVLYELLAGANCFRTENPIATLEKVQRLRPVPPSRANREIPQAVDRILARCLAKDRNRRFPDGIALYEALGEFLDKRNFRGREALAEHMAQSFAKEREEEERELVREEEEVALFDVVDFTLMGEDAGLDAENVAVSLQEEASHLSVQRPGLPEANDEGEVFEQEAAEASTGDAIRGGISAPVGLSDFVDSSEQKTVARSRRFEDPDDGPAEGKVELASLLESRTIDVPPPRLGVVPASDPSAPGSMAPWRTKEILGAALPEGGALAVTRTDLLQGIDALVTAEHGLSGPAASSRLGRLLLVAVALGGAVVGLAVLVSFGIDAQKPTPAKPAVVAPAVPAKRTKIEPVTITPEEAPAKAPRERDKEVARSGEPEEAPKAGAEVRSVEKGRATPASAHTTTHVVPASPEKKAPEPKQPPEPARAEPAKSAPKSRPAAPTKPAPKTTARAPGKEKIGYLNVGSILWAEITIDGKKWPYQTPQAGIELPEGKHTITLRNTETGVTHTESVQIVGGTVRTVSGDMRKK